jgi:hypothetical protein
VILAVVVGLLLAVGCVLFVARPFLLDPEAQDDRLDEPDELERLRIGLLERRDRALAALKELEFDHRSGKVSDADYRDVVGPLRREAAAALRALEPRASERRKEQVVTGIEPPSQPEIPEPYPPPGELDPPSHPDIPEPYPPPGETEPPAPPQVPEPYPPAPDPL